MSAARGFVGDEWIRAVFVMLDVLFDVELGKRAFINADGRERTRTERAIIIMHKVETRKPPLKVVFVSDSPRKC